MPTSSQKSSSCSSFILCALLATVLLSGTVDAAGSAKDTAYATTLELYAGLPGAVQPPAAEEQRLLKSLTYTEMRALRAFCALPAMTREEAGRILRELPTRKIRYQHVGLLEKLVAIDGATVADCWRLLERLAAIDFVSSRVLAGLADVAAMTVGDLFRLIDRIEELDEPGRWAAGGLFSVRGITAAEVAQGLDLIDAMGERQRWAAEQQCRIKRITSKEALAGMAQLQSLSASDAWTTG